MRPVVLDFETFFTDDRDARGQKYTLTHLSTEQYIRHPWFEAHGAAIKWAPDIPARWYDERQLRQVLKEEDWSDVFLIAHHAQFDGFILAYHYHCAPKMWGCTLSMARLVLGTHVSASLDSVRSVYSLPAKRTPYSLFKGRHWKDLTPEIQAQVAEGACDEVESIWTIFKALAKEFPAEEFAVVDATIRMFTEPTLRGDRELLAVLWESENKNKRDREDALGIGKMDLQSADKFQALLEAAGVEIEYKDGKNGEIAAFAKTDEFMRGLLEHENDYIRGLAEARIGAKSTLLQTRAETLGWMGTRGPLPVYKRYCGAHTTRWSGGDGTNFENFKRGSDIRRAILAPEGYLLGVLDYAQIEARLLAYLAGQEDLTEQFRRGEDVYSHAASQFYGRTITKDDASERGTGKQLILSCGYGCGAAKFQATAKLGIYGPPIKLDLLEAERAVIFYRERNFHIVNYWKTASRMIARLAGGAPVEWGPMLVKDGKIYLPNSAFLDYTTLEYHTAEDGDRFWRIKKRHGWTKLYGGKLVENVVQALARVILSQAMLKILPYYKIPTTTHDELMILIPLDGREKEHLAWCKSVMQQVPSWVPGLPIDVEASMAERYAK